MLERERLVDQPVEELAAAVERAAEALLLGADPAHDRVALGRQRRVDRREHLDRALGEAAEVGRLEAEHAPLVDGAAHDPPQHVAAALVRGDDAVGDQLDRAADVVGDDPHRPGRGRVVGAVGAAGELGGEVDERPQQVGVEDRVDALLDRRHPLEAEAGVDVLRRQLAQRAVLVEVVGGEDEVPVLEEAVGVVAGAVVGDRRRPRRGRCRAPSRGRTGPCCRPARSSPSAAAGRSAPRERPAPSRARSPRCRGRGRAPRRRRRP